MDNDLKVPFRAPLNAGDTENTTYGCRQNNPNICGHNGIEGQCAFASEDYICRTPSKAWRKQFTKLSEEKKG